MADEYNKQPQTKTKTTAGNAESKSPNAVTKLVIYYDRKAALQPTSHSRRGIDVNNPKCNRI
jgi:hypothetical protein